MKKLVALIAGVLVASVVTQASADYVIRDGNTALQTVFAYVCQTTKICSAAVPTNSSGQELATLGNPFRIDPTGTTTQPTSAVSRANLATNQVSVAATATLVVAARAGRDSVTVENHGTTDVYVGSSSGVTTSTGILLPGTKGAAITLSYSGAVYAIVATGTQTVSYAEGY